jgi:hypothetical protein
VVATRVTPVADGIETEGGVDFAGGRITALTRYELTGKRLLVTTTG